MRTRAHTAASYVDDATMLHVGHVGSFKIPRAIRHFCLTACLYTHGPGTRKGQPCCMAELIQMVKYKDRSNSGPILKNLNLICDMLLVKI